MDRKNNDRSMIDRNIAEKNEFHFPAVHFPVMAWASLVCFACFALYLSCPPSAGTDAPRAMSGPRLYTRKNGLPAAFGPVKTEGFVKNDSPRPPSFGPARCGPENPIFASQVKYPLSGLDHPSMLGHPPAELDRLLMASYGLGGLSASAW